MNSHVTVIINGAKIGALAVMPLSYRDVADIAGFMGLSPSMTVRIKGMEGRIVHPCESVMPVDGMMFNVADTSNA